MDNELLLDLAQSQSGLLTRRQALEYGLTEEALRQHLHRDRWQRVLPGVYATFSGLVVPAHREQAALLYAGDGAQLAGISACRKYGLRYVPPDDGRVHVLVPHGRRPSSTAFVVIRRTRDVPDPVCVHRLSTCPPPRAVMDACRTLGSLRDVRALMADAVNRQLVGVTQLDDELLVGCSAGSALPRQALVDVRAGCRSAPECELRELFKQSRILPEPLWNVSVSDSRGNFLGYVDALLRDAHLGIEVNSREWHLEGDAFEATMARSSRFAAAGILIVPVSPSRIRRDSRSFLREVEEAYQERI